MTTVAAINETTKVNISITGSKESLQVSLTLGDTCEL